MRGTPKPLRTDVDREHEAMRGDIVYLARRPRYEFVLTVSPEWPHGPHRGRVFCQVHFRGRHDGQAVTLDVAGLTDFYDGPSQFMEYIHTSET